MRRGGERVVVDGGIEMWRWGREPRELDEGDYNTGSEGAEVRNRRNDGVGNHGGMDVRLTLRT